MVYPLQTSHEHTRAPGPLGENQFRWVGRSVNSSDAVFKVYYSRQGGLVLRIRRVIIIKEESWRHGKSLSSQI